MLLKKLGRYRSLGFCTFAAGAIALASLQACGGGGDADTAEPMSMATGAAPDAADLVEADGDVRKKVYFVGSTQGFVAKALVSAGSTGTADDYDLLVIGDADQAGPAVQNLVRDALAKGKEVVLDGPSDGSARSTHADILQAVVGTNIDVAAVQVKKAEQGYYVIPIDAPAVAEAKAQAAAARGLDLGSNSVQNVFGIRAQEAIK